ncbi:putative Zn(2)-C6 fungal-type domain-containing protein [Seiridium cardinale]
MADHGTPSSAHDASNNNNNNTNTNTNVSSTAGTGTGSARSVKRPRPVKSCIECRNRKLKCDRLCPCSQCQKSSRTCRYAADGDVNNLSEGSDVEAPERPPKKQCLTNIHEIAPKPRDRIVTVPNGLLEDHGTRLDRLEKIVLSNAKSPMGRDYGLRAPPLASSSVTIRGLTVKGGLRTRFFGQNSTRVLLNLFDEAKEFMFAKNKPHDVREIFTNIQKIHKSLQEEQRKALAPITVYVDSITPVHKRMADVLPKRPVCDRLLQVFLAGSESLYRSVHIPTFMNQYERWWDGTLQSESFLAQLLSMLCIGYRFYGAEKGLGPDRESIHIPTACSLVKEWLHNLRGKQLMDFGTLQAEVLLLMAQRMINPNNQDSWAQLGLIVRMAMTMGLHRDPSEFPQKISPFWGELRRRVWYTILELDLQMCIQCNMPACIREGDYTCRPPSNVDDGELTLEMRELPEPKPVDQATDAQIQVFAASTLSVRFKVIDIINRLDSLTDYQPVIDCGNALEKIFEDMRYILLRRQPTNQEEATRQWLTKTVIDMHLRRALIALYRPFALSTPEVPQEILTSYLRSSVVMLTYMDDLDPASPSYTQIFHMHHLVLKQDVLQAAFSVCYYIKHVAALAEGTRSPRPYPHVPASRPDSFAEACLLATESSVLLSRSRLVHVMERALDAMTSRIREIGTDLKDLVSLTVVLALCQGGPPEVAQQRVVAGLRAIIDTGLQSMHTSQNDIAAIPILQHSPIAMNSMGNSAGFMNSVPPFLISPDIPNMIPDDFAMWDMEFWNPLLQNGS